MTKRKRAYLAYLDSAHWRTLRAKAIERDRCCRICGTVANLRVHHRRYKKDLRQCTIEDLEVYCQKHHEELHRFKKAERRANRKPRRVNIERLILEFSATLLLVVVLTYSYL